jgi:glycosidase
VSRERKRGNPLDPLWYKDAVIYALHDFDNARVRQAVPKVMRFWLDVGVDGLRLDAVIDDAPLVISA